MKVDRNKIYIGKTFKNDEGYSEMTPSERVSFIWELTAEVWSLKNKANVERRLQRNITKLIKK